MLGKAPEGDVILALEVSREPRLQWQLFLTIEIHKALDDRGQQLTQVVPGAKKGITSGFGGFLVPAGATLTGGFVITGNVSIRGIGKYPGLSCQVPLQLQKGNKAAKTLTELKGVITAWLLIEAEHEKDKDRPARIGFPAPKRTTVNIPFTLKDVPLPK